MDDIALKYLAEWRSDWCAFASDVLRANLDEEQKAVLRSVQKNPMTAVASGTSRGKDFVAACAALCFMYLTPEWDDDGNLIRNTKIALSAPSQRQVENIMTPEVRRLFRNAGVLPGRLVANDIRTDYEEYFLTGFKADNKNQEVWSGFHAANVMFVITEASGVSETIFSAIEGNLQGNSRLLLVFNPNITTGYAANAMKSDRFAKFRLDSLNATNVTAKREIIPGQVNYEWVEDKVKHWCTPITKEEYNEGEGDFLFENNLYRPNDLFRIKVRGMFPKVAEDVLIPYEWIEIANKRWQENHPYRPRKSCKLGVDVAGMGRDNSVFCPRYGNYVSQFDVFQSAGKASHMHVVGKALSYKRTDRDIIFIDTIGEGAGVYSRLVEQGIRNIFSVKNSQGAKGLHDITGEYSFANMRAYLYWALRDWLDPKNNFFPMLPPCDQFTEEATETKWKFRSDGKILIEPKEEIKKRIKRSPDYMDALSETFYPYSFTYKDDAELLQDFL